jgi:glycerol-3-phosphate dehydrogenase
MSVDDALRAPAGRAGHRGAVDVAIVGGGVVGAAIARELSGHRVSVALLEARNDVGDATSKANTAILHTGYDAKPGTLESLLVARGSQLFVRYAAQTGIPVERTGALTVAWTAEQQEALPGLSRRASENGYRQCRIVDADRVYREVPDLGHGALGALMIPDESITCTWTATLALATEARLRGVDVRLGFRVESVVAGEELTELGGPDGSVRARFVINAAGLGADAIDGLFGHRRFTVTPRRGELVVFDKLARRLANRIVLPVPSSIGKGVLISPTIYGNVLVGPTAEDLEDKANTATSQAGIASLLEQAGKLMPSLVFEELTAAYSGLRAAIDRDDYLIETDAAQRYVLVAGIRSTGLTAALAIAEHVREQLAGVGLELTPRDDLPDPPQMPNLGEAFPRPYEDAARIARDTEYGRIVCFCERVTAGEIRDAFASTIPPRDLNGLRRRTRVMNGRCQGFYCGAKLQTLVDEHTRRAGAALATSPQPR